MNGLVSGGDDQGFLKEGLNTYLMAAMSPLQLPTFIIFFCLHIYSLWSLQAREYYIFIDLSHQ